MRRLRDEWRWILGAIAGLGLAAGGIWWGLARQGIVDLDESAYLFSAVTDRLVLDWILAGKNYNIMQQLALNSYPIVNEAWAKPLWHIVAVASTYLFNLPLEALAVVNAIIGTICAALFLVLCRLWLSRRWMAHVLAFCFFLLSPFVIYYFRVRLAHSLCLMLLLGCMVAEELSRRARSKRRWIWLTVAGLCGGGAFTAHASCLPLLLVIVGWQVVAGWLRRRLAEGCIRALVLVGVMILPLMAMQGATAWFIFESGPELQAYRYQHAGIKPMPNMDYFDQLKFNFLSSTRPPKPTSLSQGKTSRIVRMLEHYLYRPWVCEGSIRLGLWLIGWLVALGIMGRRLRKAEGMEEGIILGAAAALSILGGLFSGLVVPAARLLLNCWPFCAIVAGWGLDQCFSRRPRVLICSGLTTLLVLSVVNLWPLYHVKSGYDEIASWLKGRGEHEVGFLQAGVTGRNQLVCFGMRVRSFYTPQEVCRAIAPRYVVATFKHSVLDPFYPKRWHGLMERIERFVPPVLVTQFRPLVHSYEFWRRGRCDLIDYVSLMLLGRTLKRGAMCVHLYRLEDLKQWLLSDAKNGPVWPKECGCD